MCDLVSRREETSSATKKKSLNRERKTEGKTVSVSRGKEGAIVKGEKGRKSKKRGLLKEFDEGKEKER